MKTTTFIRTIIVISLIALFQSSVLSQNFLDGLNNLAKGINQVSKELVKDKKTRTIIDATSRVIDEQTQYRNRHNTTSYTENTSISLVPSTHNDNSSDQGKSVLKILVPEGGEQVSGGIDVVTMWKSENLNGIATIYLISNSDEYYLGKTRVNNEQLNIHLPESINSNDTYQIVIKVQDENGSIIKTSKSKKFSINL